MEKLAKEIIDVQISKEANRIVTDNDIIVKTLQDKKIFVDAILNPEMPNEYLKQAQKNLILVQPNIIVVSKVFKSS